MTVTNTGGKFEIPLTGVILTIPPNALPTGMEQCVMHMRLTASRIVEDQVKSLCSNSSTAVEIFPCNLALNCSAKLSLPHCLKFKKRKERRARIFTNLESGMN
ncbi:hypothetical protein HOLleu_42121 [Holothuria leucospilota]|uniref:ZU5 domain-containing protein n=1 Tax=Holothuria leucospilota TaxID=206669 RepID=A0A9Q0YDA1_HOLLE|nr:hypothetical protein HOLleu_42121 [Holothuria leucospilota]